MLCGDAFNLQGFWGEPITDGTFLLWFNARREDIEVGMPGHANVRWRLILDTADEAGFIDDGIVRDGGGRHTLTARSLALFEQQAGTADEARDVRGKRVLIASQPTPLLLPAHSLRRSLWRDLTARFRGSHRRRR